MCWLCDAKSSLSAPAGIHDEPDAGRWSPRRGFLLAGAAAATGLVSATAQAQVDVGEASALRNLVPAEELEGAARQQYGEMLEQARAKGALAPEQHPQLQRLRQIARRLIPFTAPWNSRSRSWQWEVNLIGNSQVNAFCMPGGKICFYTGILDKLKLGDDEVAMVMGHEMAHALREHARERLAKTQATSLGLSLGARLLGLGELGNVAADLGTQLLAPKYRRDDEPEAGRAGLELGARGAYNPQASVSLWRKMMAANGSGGPGFLSTHPSGPNRIQELQDNLPRVRQLYEQARG